MATEPTSPEKAKKQSIYQNKVFLVVLGAFLGAFFTVIFTVALMPLTNIVQSTFKEESETLDTSPIEYCNYILEIEVPEFPGSLGQGWDWSLTSHRPDPYPCFSTDGTERNCLPPSDPARQTCQNSLVCQFSFHAERADSLYIWLFDDDTNELTSTDGDDLIGFSQCPVNSTCHLNPAPNRQNIASVRLSCES